MKLVLQEFLTLDGVSQGPGSPDEDTSDGFTRGGWFVPHLDEEFERLAGTWLGERTRSCSAAVPTRTSRGTGRR